MRSGMIMINPYGPGWQPKFIWVVYNVDLENVFVIGRDGAARPYSALALKHIHSIYTDVFTDEI